MPPGGSGTESKQRVRAELPWARCALTPAVCQGDRGSLTDARNRQGPQIHSLQTGRHVQKVGETIYLTF